MNKAHDDLQQTMTEAHDDLQQTMTEAHDVIVPDHDRTHHCSVIVETVAGVTDVITTRGRDPVHHCLASAAAVATEATEGQDLLIQVIREIMVAETMIAETMIADIDGAPNIEGVSHTHRNAVVTLQ
jgi:hypothetical protein